MDEFEMLDIPQFEILLKARESPPPLSQWDLEQSFWQALGNCDIKVTGTALARGVNPDLRNHNKHTALCCAVMTGNPTMVELLLDKGASVDLPAHEGVTGGNRRVSRALHVALTLRHPRIARVLLERGADPNMVPSCDVVPPLVLAIPRQESDTFELMDLMFQYNMDISGAALMKLIPHVNASQLTLLLNRGFAPSLLDSQQFMQVGKECHPSILEVLMEKGANGNVPVEGIVPLDMTVEQVQRSQMVKLFGATKAAGLKMANFSFLMFFLFIFFGVELSISAPGAIHA